MLNKGRDTEEHIRNDIGYRETANMCQNCRFSTCEGPAHLICNYNPSFKLKVKHLSVCDKYTRI